MNNVRSRASLFENEQNGRPLRSHSLEIQPLDTGTFVSVVCIMTFASLLESLVPAWRVMKADPAKVLCDGADRLLLSDSVLKVVRPDRSDRFARIQQ